MTGHLREPSIPCDYNAFVHLAVPLPPPASSQRGCGAGWQRDRDRGGGDGGGLGQGGGDRRQKSGRVALRLRTGLQGPGEWRWRKPKTTFPISLDHPPRGRICTRRGTRLPPRTTGAQGLSAPGSCDTLRKCVPLPGRCPTPAPQKTERGRRGGRCGGWSPFPRRPSAAVSRAAGTQVTATHAHSRAYGQAAHSGDRWPFTNPVAIALKGAGRGPQTGSKIPQATGQARKPAHHSLGSRCPVCLAAPPPISLLLRQPSSPLQPGLPLPWSLTLEAHLPHPHCHSPADRQVSRGLRFRSLWHRALSSCRSLTSGGNRIHRWLPAKPKSKAWRVPRPRGERNQEPRFSLDGVSESKGVCASECTQVCMRARDCGCRPGGAQRKMPQVWTRMGGGEVQLQGTPGTLRCYFSAPPGAELGVPWRDAGPHSDAQPLASLLPWGAPYARSPLATDPSCALRTASPQREVASAGEGRAPRVPQAPSTRVPGTSGTWNPQCPEPHPHPWSLPPHPRPRPAGAPLSCAPQFSACASVTSAHAPGGLSPPPAPLTCAPLPARAAPPRPGSRRRSARWEREEKIAVEGGAKEESRSRISEGSDTEEGP